MSRLSINKNKLFHVDKNMAEIGPGEQLPCLIMPRSGSCRACIWRSRNARHGLGLLIGGRPGKGDLVKVVEPLGRRSAGIGRDALGPEASLADNQGVVHERECLGGDIRHVRRPMVENGAGVSKARNIGLRKLRRTFK